MEAPLKKKRNHHNHHYIILIPCVKVSERAWRTNRNQSYYTIICHGVSGKKGIKRGKNQGDICFDSQHKKIIAFGMASIL